MDLELTDRVVIVTGASSGIGEATALLLATSGAKVLAVGRDPGRLQSVVEQIAREGGTGHPIEADLLDAEAAAAVAREAAERHGRIDGIVHAAGVYEPLPFADTPLDCLDRQWAIHVRAPFVMTQTALEHLSDGASVVFISSTVARSGFGGCAAYTATKGAVESMARSLAIELAPRVRVNVLAPGFVLTPMVTSQIDENPALEGELVKRTPVGFVGQAEDIARAIVFVCSPQSRYVSGSALVVDGGWTAQAWQA
jgi:NAD(P)-dependent dehydrogenase (short-subunit alcohol dehydrogenase family)